MRDTQLAIELIELGARPQVLESETTLSRERLLKLGAQVVHSGVMDVHATGHAQADFLDATRSSPAEWVRSRRGDTLRETADLFKTMALNIKVAQLFQGEQLLGAWALKVRPTAASKPSRGHSSIPTRSSGRRCARISTRTSANARSST